ncbi:peptidase S8 [Halomicronema hongdechloris C2206]|uniref:Peptidase S8 n=1 Tax=Halomicronema hongdechloris C2206 TaxID=1641165 RepID=A0A1Z3HGH8_9CYAN|nr:S8 family serine peptidase [Halomicronema hongdechloris]ASC69384.1 peptidase S8 [Halomicronema hongdechloris C2206]
MRPLFSGLLLTGLTLSALSMLPPRAPGGDLTGSVSVAPAQAQTREDELYYTFYGQRVPLTLRQDQIAVALKSQPSGARGGPSPFQQLQHNLLGRPAGGRAGRGGEAGPALEVTLRPLGNRYAVIELPEVSAELRAAVQQRLQRPYVEATLPVLSRSGEEDTIILPNEIVVSFEPDAPASQVQLTLSRYGLEEVRPLRFSQNRYLVSRRDGAGLQVLNVANQLNGVAGIQSATPNFVQTLPYRAVPQSLEQLAIASSRPNPPLDNLLARLSGPRDWPVATDLFPLHWHLDSTAFRGTRQPRTDIRVTEAWSQGSQGEGVVVAVIDSLIQWDHPDLADNLYAIAEDQAGRLPGEVHGWDFSNRDTTCQADRCAVGDPDTRISDAELDLVRTDFQNTFTLSDGELLQTYRGLANRIANARPKWSQRQIANVIRGYIQGDIMAEFHGTWSSGVVAANPGSARGAVGVAPEAEILPVRVFGLGGEITVAALVEAIGYAAERGVDVINLSLGGLLPDRELTDQIMAVLDAHPDLVIVASAGNDSLDGVGFPAAIPAVISVGATTLEGERTVYSSYGGGLDVVAPGGDISQVPMYGILTTGGTWVPGFWQGIEQPIHPWSLGLDPLGHYVQVQGTSFSAPATTGTVALMLAANGDLTRAQVSQILQTTADYEGLALTQSEMNQYRLQAAVGLGTVVENQVLRPTGIFSFPEPISPEQYYFGGGLVNAAAAVEQARKLR